MTEAGVDLEKELEELGEALEGFFCIVACSK
jgi:hypothetical protein